MGQSIELSQTI